MRVHAGFCVDYDTLRTFNRQENTEGCYNTAAASARVLALYFIGSVYRSSFSTLWRAAVRGLVCLERPSI